MLKCAHWDENKNGVMAQLFSMSVVHSRWIIWEQTSNNWTHTATVLTKPDCQNLVWVPLSLPAGQSWPWVSGCQFLKLAETWGGTMWGSPEARLAICSLRCTADSLQGTLQIAWAINRLSARNVLIVSIWSKPESWIKPGCLTSDPAWGEWNKLNLKFNFAI